MKEILEVKSSCLSTWQFLSEDSTYDFRSPVVDVVLPVYNEAESIREVVLGFYNEIATKLPIRLIVAEDGSNDGTKDVLLSLKKEIPISLFCGPYRKGFAKGVSDAFRRCSAQWVLFSDSDGQYYPSDFWRLWENRYGYDMLIGHKLVRKDPLHRTILANGFHSLVNALFGVNLHDADSGFRLIQKRVIDAVLSDVHFLKYSFSAEFAIRAAMKGFKIAEIPISHTSRVKGETQIYKPSKIPFIVIEQLQGLARLYAHSRKIDRRIDL